MNTNNLNTGDTVYASFGKYATFNVQTGTVTKKSPNGTVQVTFGTRTVSFKPNGHERGVGTYDGGMLIDFDTYVRQRVSMLIQQAERNATKLARDAANVAITQANRDEVITKLEAALTAARAIPQK